MSHALWQLFGTSVAGLFQGSSSATFSPFASRVFLYRSMLLPSSLRVVGILVLVLGFSAAGEDDSAMPGNLGGGLRQLAAWQAARVSALPQARSVEAARDQIKSVNPRAQTDGAGRVVVDIYLNGAAQADQVRRGLEALGLTILAFEPA